MSRVSRLTICCFAVCCSTVLELEAQELADAVLVVPPGLEAGDSYHLVFASREVRDGLGTDVAEYDAFVQSAADAAGIGASMGISWRAMMSFGDVDAPQIDARDYAVVGADSPVLNTCFDRVADGYADLWDGSIEEALRCDESGVTVTGDAWTGSQPDGTSDPVDYLGSATPTAWCGSMGTNDDRWFRIANPRKTISLHVYGLSEELTVDPFESVAVSLDTPYSESFDSLGQDAAAGSLLPGGWLHSDDDVFYFNSTTEAFPVDRVFGPEVLNAGTPDDPDRALALVAANSSADTAFQVIAIVEGEPAGALRLQFDVEAWGAADIVQGFDTTPFDDPGEAAFLCSVDIDTGDGFTPLVDLGSVSTGAVLSPPAEGPIDGNLPDYNRQFDSGFVAADVQPGARLRLRWRPDVSVPVNGWTIGLDNVELSLATEPPNPGAFRRGDVNGDGSMNISDGIFLLNYLFGGGDAPGCDDAADINDTGTIDISDPIGGINFLFSGSNAPAPPGHLECGPDPTDDEFVCVESPCP